MNERVLGDDVRHWTCPTSYYYGLMDRSPFFELIDVGNIASGNTEDFESKEQNSDLEMERNNLPTP